MDCSPPGSSVHGIFQASTLERVAISSSRGSSWPRDWTQVSCTVGRSFIDWATRKTKVHVKNSYFTPSPFFWVFKVSELWICPPDLTTCSLKTCSITNLHTCTTSYAVPNLNVLNIVNTQYMLMLTKPIVTARTNRYHRIPNVRLFYTFFVFFFL